MSSLTNVNNNAAVVVVGRTAPVPPGQQPAAKSIPVVLASDQTPIPVVEQNKIASEVALSLLGIPRAEVALGIFADVNTYDVNPSEWSSKPEIRQELEAADDPAYNEFNGKQGWGTKHLPEESGALVEAPADKVAVLTSKRFFRYQPGRVSATTFGVKTSVIPGDPVSGTTSGRNPAIRKYGAFDNYDGYYWETRDTGKGDQLAVVRRTSSLILRNPIPFGAISGQQQEDYGVIGPRLSGETEPAGGLPSNEFNLVVLRDGLVHVHAAVYDPSLLRTETFHAIAPAVAANTISLTRSTDQPELLNGQHVIYQTNEATTIPIIGSQAGLVKEKIYKIVSKTDVINNVYTVKLAEITEQLDTSPIALGTVSGTTHRLKTPVPFIFPEISTTDAADIMWPLQRSFNIKRANISPVGIIDTTQSISTTQSNILSINDGSIETHWKYWVKQNVNPEFYRVYEYRIPRSRFSGDFLDGAQGTSANKVLYSDVVRTGSGNDTIKRPGQFVNNVATNSIVTKDSIWNLDFTKVTMQKVEYSWYGAVGALFLAYIPVSNGEARWVRVHHIRCSNQLKVPSLGNPTLPITYLVYGGGSQNRYGYPNSSENGAKRVGSIYNNYSEFIVKYGASYYIDGGDRGTVRLYSYSSPIPAEVYGSKYGMKTSSVVTGNNPYLEINEAYTAVATGQVYTVTALGSSSEAQWKAFFSGLVGTQPTLGQKLTATATGSISGGGTVTPNPLVSDFYMGATVLTIDPADQGVKVTWVDTTTTPKRLYLNKALNSLTGVVRFDVLANRPQITFGLKTKTEIVSSQQSRVRNRTQVYPTRLAVGSLGSSTVSIQLIKNPIFQTTSTYSGTLTLNSATVHILKPEGQPTPLTLSSTPTFADGATTYGWIQAYYTSDTNQSPNQKRFSVFGLLRRVGSAYTFTAETSFSEPIRIVGSFLYANNYDNDGTLNPILLNDFELERLSSINITNELRTPIPGTGTQVTTFFIGSGGFQFDLSPYFNYNKDYLSYPLTNKIDSLYLTSTSVDKYISAADGLGDPNGAAVLRSSVLTSLTWEEQ